MKHTKYTSDIDDVVFGLIQPDIKIRFLKILFFLCGVFF